MKIIIDIGSHEIKIDADGDAAPRFVIEPIVATETLPNVTSHALKLSYPIDQGSIVKANDFIDLLKHICNRLNADISRSSIIITQASLSRTKITEQMVQVLFEELHIENLCLPNQFKVILEGIDLKDGLVLQAGHRLTSIVPVLDGYILPYAACSSTFAGNAITLSLVEAIGARGYS